jgi:RIO kinase 1
MSSDRFIDDKWIKKLDRQLQEVIGRVGVDRKTLDQVFDVYTLNTLGKLISDKVIDIVDFPISTGKEGNVFRGVTPDKKFVALKIYRISTATFKHISQYIVGDPRFKSVRKTRKDIVFAWTKKEFKNLERLEEIGVSAPKAIVGINNVLVMSYIGYARRPAPLMKDVVLENPQEIFDTLIGFISKMYRKAELVHSDMSAFNILIHRRKPYLIDLGQGVLLEHPQAEEFLKRDIHNVVSYFKKYAIKANENIIYKNITKK